MTITLDLAGWKLEHNFRRRLLGAAKRLELMGAVARSCMFRMTRWALFYLGSRRYPCEYATRQPVSNISGERSRPR